MIGASPFNHETLFIRIAIRRYNFLIHRDLHIFALKYINMKKYTFVVTVVLMFGALNVSAQNTEKNQTQNKEELQKKEVKKTEATLKPAQTRKAVSPKNRVVQKGRIEEKKVAPIKKEQDQ